MSRRGEEATLFAPALARSGGDEMKLAQLGPARPGPARPGPWGGAKPSGGNGRPGPHLLNPARAQGAQGPRGWAEHFVVQPGAICWARAPCGRARGARSAPAGGQTGGHTQGRNGKRRAPNPGREAWKASWRKGAFKPL